MAFTTGKMSLIVIVLGLISFSLGIVGEKKKPSMGVLVQEKTAIPPIRCEYPSDPTVVLGYCSLLFLVASTLVGLRSMFYSYQDVSVPSSALFKYTTFSIYFALALATSVFAAAMTLWPTITEQYHWAYNVHRYPAECPTAKTGVMGGGAFLSLLSSLFWLCSLMLLNNAREDYFEELHPKV